MNSRIDEDSRQSGGSKTASVGNPERRWEDEQIRRLIQSELVKRCERNPKYSLRALARALELDPSTLSQVLRGKRRLAHHQVERLAQTLGWLPPTPAVATPDGAKPPPAAVPEFLSLTLDAFALIADWYHFALSQLLQLPGFDCNPKTLPKSAAHALGITVSEARIALERLERMEIIERVQDPRATTGERYVVHESNLTTVTQNEFTAAAYRKLQKQLLEKAIIALEEVPMDRRDQTSMTMRMNPARLLEARERLRKFRREFCAEFEADPACSEVYQLSFSYFPLTQITKPERNPRK